MVEAIRRAAAARKGDESGAFSALVVLLAPALFLLVGMVVDGGQAIAAHQRATAEAEQAARAGADAPSGTALARGSIQPDVRSAVAEAEDYMAQAGHVGTASLAGNTVSASVSSYQVPTTFLGLIGVRVFSVSGRGSATAVTRYGS